MVERVWQCKNNKSSQQDRGLRVSGFGMVLPCFARIWYRLFFFLVSVLFVWNAHRSSGQEAEDSVAGRPSHRGSRHAGRTGRWPSAGNTWRSSGNGSWSWRRTRWKSFRLQTVSPHVELPGRKKQFCGIRIGSVCRKVGEFFWGDLH